MRSFWFGALLCATMFAACGDDDSDFATQPSGGSPLSSSSAKANDSEYDAIANTLKDLRDGQIYRTVRIGKQVWMAENLNYKTEESYCYNDEESKCARYGRLYRWVAAISACPSGWHLPTAGELEELVVTVDGSITKSDLNITAGIKLKSTSGWKSYEGKSGNGTDDFGFSALPAGEKYGYAGDYDEGKYTTFWSSTDGGDENAYSLFLAYDRDHVHLTSGPGKISGCSVRCLKDDS